MKIKSFFKNLLFTFIAEGLVLLSFFLIYRIIAHNYGAQGAGEYSLIKKVFGFLHPIFILGIGVGLPRYIALAINREDRRDFVRAGFFSIIISCGVFLLFANIFKVFFASVFFGAPEYAEMVVPFSFFFAGLAMHGLVYSYFRGRMMAKLFNLLQLINLAIIPVLVLFLFNQHSLNVAMSVIGVLVFLVAIVFMTPFWGDLIKPGKGLKNAFGKLMRYSVPRVPGDFLMAAFFSLPIIGAAHFVSVEGAGYLSIGQGVIVAIATMLAPFGVLLLPKVSSLMAVGRENDVNINLNLFIRAILDGSLFVMVQIMIFADTIILFWLGPEFLPAAAPMRIMAISILSYAFYVSTRSVIDGAQSKPLNSINAFVSLAVALFLAAILFFASGTMRIIDLSCIFVFGLIFLSVLTYQSLRKIYQLDLFYDLKHLLSAVLVNAVIATAVIVLKPVVSGSVFAFAGFEAALALFYLFVLWGIRREWLMRMKEIILRE